MFYRLIAGLLLTLFAALVRAEVAPFGVPIGVATLKEVRASLGPKTTLKHAGTNKWSGGPMLSSDGRGLGIDGLQEATFVFNPQEKLVGVLLTLPKHRYADITSYLKQKYQLVDEATPFVGDRFATFREGPVTITAAAPHLSFEMTVNYIHSELQTAFDRGSQAEADKKRQREVSKL